MIKNLTDIQREIDVVVRCFGSEGENVLERDIPTCYVHITDEDQFLVHVLGGCAFNDVSIDLSISLGAGFVKMAKESVSKRNVYNGFLWLPGHASKADDDSNKFSARNRYASVNKIRFFNNRSGDTLLDCSGLPNMKDVSLSMTHWLEVVSRKAVIERVAYRVAICMDDLVEALTEAGIIASGTLYRYNSVDSNDWDISIPLFSRKNDIGLCAM